MLTNLDLIQIRQYFYPNSQSKFAKLLELPQTSYCSFENGKRKPSAELVEALVTKANVNPLWLFTGQGDMFNKPKNTMKPTNNDYKNCLKRFGKRLNKIRINADMLDNEIPILMCISEDRFIDLCTGTEEPSLKEIITLCENFDVSADWLLFEKL